MIIWQQHDILNAIAGGVIIGVATSILILVNGKIAGISGILGEALHIPSHDTIWRLLFLFGLALSPLLYGQFHRLPIVFVNPDNRTVILAGLLVGFGTRLGSGCTSGHGVCGIARLSLRSIVATLCFIISGAITVYLSHIMRH